MGLRKQVNAFFFFSSLQISGEPENIGMNRALSRPVYLLNLWGVAGKYKKVLLQ